MSWEKFAELMQYIVDIYGVSYGWGECEYDFPTNEFECKDAWFICPECGEPVYYCDIDTDGEYPICPSCEMGVLKKPLRRNKNEL